MNYRYLYLSGFVISVSAISFYQMRDCHRLPWPPRIVYTGLAFVALDLMSMFNEELAGVIAIGLTIALIVNKKWAAHCEDFPTSATQQVQLASFIGPSTGSPGTNYHQAASYNLFGEQ